MRILKIIAVNFLLTSLLTVLLLVTFEFILRYKYRDFTTSSDFNSYLSNRWKKQDVQINSYGFREKEFKLGGKKRGYFRIAVIGDSFTYGQGIPKEKRYSDLLQEYLSSRGGKFEVLNFGMPGAEMDYHLKSLSDYVIKIKPDYIILQLYVNDFEFNKEKRPNCSKLALNKKWHKSLNQNSILYYFLNVKFRAFQKNFKFCSSYIDYMNNMLKPEDSVIFKEGKQYLEKFIALSLKNKIKLKIIFIPDLATKSTEDLALGISYPFKYLHERIGKFCKKKSIPFIDFNTVFSKYPYREKLWVNTLDAHASVFAHELIFKELVKGNKNF